MPRNPRISLRLQLLAVFTGMVLLVALLLTLGIRFIEETGSQMEHTLQAHVRPLARLNALEAQISRIRTIELELPASTDTFVVTGQLEQLLLERENFQHKLGEALADFRYSDEAEAAALLKHWAYYEKDLGLIAELAAAMNMVELQQKTALESGGRFRAVFLTLKRLSEITELKASAAYAKSVEGHERQRVFFILTSTLGLILIALFCLYFADSLHRRLSRLRHAASALAAGQSTTMTLNGNDELTELSDTFIAMQNTITARERSLTDSQARFRDLAESASDWFWETDAALRLVYVSERFFALTGQNPAQILGQPLRIFVEPGEHPDPDIDIAWTAVAQQLDARESIRQFEYVIPLSSGGRILASLTGKPFYDAQGAFMGYRGTGTDISESVAAQADKRRAERFSTLANQVAGMAHEINSPLGISLTVATSVAEELRQFDQAYTSGTLRRSDQERFIQTAKEGFTALVPSLQRAANLIRSFKQVAVDQASDQQRRFDLRTYLDETLLSLTPLLKRTGHLIKLDGCPYGLTMDSYPGALSQIITNLVMNSVLHGFENKANGLIEIAAHVEGKTLILSYRDDGAGLAPAQLAHLYEPFYTTKRQRGGSGLGMHIIHNLVTQKLGGQIDLETAPGKGVAFTLRLPTGQVEPPGSVA